jgi:hypothetical protein
MIWFSEKRQRLSDALNVVLRLRCYNGAPGE